MALRPRDARVARRAELANQPELLERRLELRAEHAPLDPFGRAERRFDRRPLPVAPEVRPQPRSQVAGAADVQHLVAASAEEIDARPGRRAEREVALVGEAAARVAAREPRSATVRAPRSCASPMSASNSSAVARASGSARWQGCASVPRNHASCPSEKLFTRPASNVRASRTVSTTGAAMREPEPLGLAVEEGEVEARVVGDEDCVAGEVEEAPHRLGRTRRAPQLLVAKAVMADAPGAIRSPGSTSVSNSSTCSSPRIRTAPISQIAEVSGRSPVVSRSTTM